MVTHIIESKDTLWDLARRHNTTVQAITNANPGIKPKQLQIGQSIIIPDSSGTAGLDSFTRTSVKSPVVKPKSSSSMPVVQNFTKQQIMQKIRLTARKYGVDEYLALALVQHESNFNPRAKSRTGAVGLFQLTGSAVRQLGVKKTYDVDKNIEYGTRYLKWCLQNTDTVEEALVAYNAGIGKLRDALADGIPIDSITEKKNGKGYAANVLEIYESLSRK